MTTIRTRMERLVEGKKFSLPKPLPFKKLKIELMQAVDAVEAAEKQTSEANNKLHDLAYSKAEELRKRGVDFYSDDEEDTDSAALRSLISLYKAYEENPSAGSLRRLISSLPDQG